MTLLRPGSPLVFPVEQLTIVLRTVSMRDVLNGGAVSKPVFAVRDREWIHPVWAMDVFGHAFIEATTAEEVGHVRASLRALYRSDRPVLDALADEGFWPSGTHAVKLERRELLHFHPTTLILPARYVQTFAVVSLCASGKHVRASFDGPTCPTGLAWNADEPL